MPLHLAAGAPLTCQDCGALVQVYVDGELEGAERAEFESHLASCARCSAAAEEHRAFKRRLREAGASSGVLNAPASSALRARIGAELSRMPPPRRPRVLRPAFAYPALIATAAAAAGIVLWLESPGRGGPDELVQDAVAHHRRELPLEVQDPQLDQIQSWFKGKVDFAPTRIPRIRRANLIGARLSNLSNRQAAYVAWGTPNQRRVSLFVFDAPDLRVAPRRRVNDHDVYLANQHGYNVAIWKEKEIAYSLVSDLGEQDILELVAGSAP